jgi:FkbM family methyltransferase
MPYYQPQTAWETALATLSVIDGRAGRNARRWLRRRYVKRTMADFQLLLTRLGPESVCLDLGANVGTVTLQMAATGATVHAFEPDPYAFAELQRNVGHLGNVVLHQAAVAMVGGQNLLQRRSDFAENPGRNSKMSSLTPISPALFAGGEAIPVETRAFKDVLGLIGGPVALLKMDIEGAEFDILRMIFADPAAFDIDAIFCETHEYAFVEQKPEVERMIRASDSLARPYVNLYWP